MCAPLTPPATYTAMVTAIAHPQVISNQSPAPANIVGVRPDSGSPTTASATTPAPNASRTKVPKNSASSSLQRLRARQPVLTPILTLFSSSTGPSKGSLDGLLPTPVVVIAPFPGHSGSPGAIDRPIGAQVLGVVPEAYRQPRRVRRTQCRGLGHFGTDHGSIENVRLKLHEQRIGHHAPVDFQARQLDAAVSLHGLDHIADLVSRGFQSGAGDVRAIGI